jgi:hypothetical protein
MLKKGGLTVNVVESLVLPRVAGNLGRTVANTAGSATGYCGHTSV